MREFREKRWVINGPVHIANSHRKLAEKLLGQIKRIDIELGGLSQTVRRYVLPDNTRIVVESRFGQDIVRIDTSQAVEEAVEFCQDIALEAGLVNTVPYHPLQAGTYEAATISPTARSSDNRYTINPEPFSDSPPSVESEDFASCTDSQSLSIEDEALRDAILEKRTIMQYYPASVFTGEMRVFMQALYSSQVSASFPLTSESDFEQKEALFFLGEQIDNTLARSTGVFAQDDQYWLLHVTQSGITVREMLLSECGLKLQEAYQNGLLDISAEVYRSFIYSQVTSLGETETLTDSDIAEAYSRGAPWYYGWKFSSATGEISIVHRRGADDGTFEGSLTTINIGRQDGEWTLSVELGELYRYYFDRGPDKLWVPDEQGGGMALVVTSDAITPPDISGAPIYCFYDDNDELIVATHSRSSYGAGEDDPSYSTFPVNKWVCGLQGTPDTQQNRTWTGGSDHGFSIGASVYTGEDKGGVLFQYEEIGSTGQSTGAVFPLPNNTEHDCSGNLIAGPVCQGFTHSTKATETGGTGTLITEFSNESGSQNAISLLVIPWHDASAVYAGIHNRFLVDQHRTTQTNQLRRWITIVDCDTEAPSTIYGSRVYKQASVDPDFNGIIAPDVETSTDNYYRQFSDLLVSLHNRAGQEIIATDADTSTVQYFGWSSVLSPSFSFPFTTYRFSVISSAQNPAANILYTGDIDDNEFVTNGAVSCSVDEQWRYIGWI